MFTQRRQQNQHRIWLFLIVNSFFWELLFLPLFLVAYFVTSNKIANPDGTYTTTHWFSLGQLGIVLIIILGILILINHNKQTNLMHRYQHVAKYLIQNYDAKLIHNRDTYQILMNVVDEICTALDFQNTEIYLIETNDIDNVTAVSNNDTNYIFITTHLLQTLSRYELEAVIAVSLIDLETDYQKLNLIRYLTYWKLTHSFKKYGYFFLFIWMMLASVGLLDGYLIYFILNILMQHDFRTHLNHINTDAIRLTNNPQVLITAFTKMSQTQHNFVPNENFVDILWLNPLNLNTTWSLNKQLTELKQF